MNGGSGGRDDKVVDPFHDNGGGARLCRRFGVSYFTMQLASLLPGFACQRFNYRYVLKQFMGKSVPLL